MTAMGGADTQSTAAAPARSATVSARDWIAHAVAILDSEFEYPRREVELILSAVLGLSRSRLLVRLDEALPAASIAHADALLARRAAGEPVAYLLEEWEFWSLPLRVTPQVLVPRPETEGVVARGLALLGGNQTARILDLGTGSGAIALALAHSLPQAEVVATDCCEPALAVARGNAKRLGLRVQFLVGGWYDALPPGTPPFDLIVSNPPYVARGDAALEAAVARYEPAVALYAAQQGTAAFAAIVGGAPAHLVTGGQLVLEHGAEQVAVVSTMLQQGGFCEVVDTADLSGLPRVASGRWRERQQHG